MDAVYMLIKPVSGACNLACKYCFYQDVMEKRSEKNLGIMDDQTRDALIEKAIGESEKAVSFAFQGGEPTLAGLDFYKAFVKKARSCKKPGMRIFYSIQTNGMVLDKAWARFFKENGFLVGLSLDGDKACHDEMRVDIGGKGSFLTVSKSASLLSREGVDFNILCVVTSNTARRARAVYSYFKKQGYPYIQYIPCLDPFDVEHGSQPFSLTPQKYGTFLKTTFDAWYDDLVKGEYVSIRYFDDLVNVLAGKGSSSCALLGTCGSYFVIEADGGVYPCDFYVLDEWRMGNIRELSFLKLFETKAYKEFLRRGDRRPEKCEGCVYQPVCGGGCQRDRIWEEGQVRHVYCDTLRSFFEYAMPRLSEIARMEARY